MPPADPLAQHAENSENAENAENAENSENAENAENGENAEEDDPSPAADAVQEETAVPQVSSPHTRSNLLTKPILFHHYRGTSLIRKRPPP